MRYKYFLPKIISTAALAGALTLTAAPQDENINIDPESQSYSESTTVVQTAPAVTSTTVVQTSPAAGMSDGTIARKIHKAISRDVTMSNRALDVRIICKNGVVTLKGSVPTTMEKKRIEAKAAEMVGSANVTDNIKVKHKNYLG